MAVNRCALQHLGNHFLAQHLQGLATAHGQQLGVAGFFQFVQAPVGLRHGTAHRHHTMVLHEQHLLVLQDSRQALPFTQGFGQAGVAVVVGDAVVEKRRGLAGGQQAVVLQHIECCGPRLVGVQHHFRAAQAMQRCVYALGRQLNHTLAFQGLTGFIEHHHVAGSGLGPMLAKGQHQVSIFAAWYGHGEVVVYAFFKTIQHRQAQGGGQMDFGLPHRIRSRTVYRMN